MAKNCAVRVYSYIRFSTPEQAEGDSIRRQVDVAKAWAEKHGHVLDDELRLTDLGRSAFRGSHRTKGALGRFVELVERGCISPGSILLVENIDRLSREDFVQAFDTVSRIITNGITIVTLSPYAEYTREALKGGMIWQLVGQMQLAHEASLRKSDFGQANWKHKREQAREDGRVLTRRCPNWLTVTDDGTFNVIPGAVAAVQLIFKLKLEGFGTRTIAIKLNATAPWKPERGWRDSYVKKTLRNRAVIGEYQPHQRTTGKRVPCGEPIPDYYPVVITSDVFFAVQELFRQNRRKGGRRDRVANLFTHLVKCAYCGGTMHFVDKGAKGGQFLRCDNGYRGNGCARHTIRYDECEAVVLENCHLLRPEEVLPNPQEQTTQCQFLRQRIAGMEGELRDVEQQLDNFIDQIGKTKVPAVRNRCEAKVQDLERRKTAIAEQIQQDQQALTVAEQGLRSFTKWVADLKALEQGLATGDVDLRRRLQSHLREFISRIDVFAIGHPKEYDPDAPLVPYGQPLPDVETLAEGIDAGISETSPELARTKEFRKFLKYVTQRRMSKDGRFLRVYFKTGRKKIDLVPAGSIASGKRLERLGSKKGSVEWDRVEPELQRLWYDFQGESKKRRRAAKLVTT